MAGSVRAKLLASRRIGAERARLVAACGSLDDALAMLDSTAYRITERGPANEAAVLPELAAAQHAIGAALLWDLRVLAGWLPQGGAALMRVLAGWFEIANVSEWLREADGGEPGRYFALGALATAWPAQGRPRSLAELRTTLAASAWRDPGGGSAADLAVGLRARWAQRVAALGEPARTWAASALALLLAGERFGTGGQENPVLLSVATALLGPAAAAAQSIDELAAALPRRVGWVLDRQTAVSELWRPEAAWWTRVEQDAQGLLARSGFDDGCAVGAAAALAADARRIWSALEIAARGGGRLEVFDAVA